MKIPLLLAGSAATCNCPEVRLFSGEWKIKTENLVSSDLLLSLNGQLFDINSIIPGPAIVQILFGFRGTETNLNVYAELQ